jgi:hypothetical protein
VNESLDPTDPLAVVEERLERLAPAPPPAHLAARLLAAEPSGRKVVHPWQWVTLAAAASIAVAAVWMAKRSREPQGITIVAGPDITPESIRIYAPISSRNLLLDAREIGVIEPDNSPPVRLVRCLWVDDSTYRSGQGGDPDLQVTSTHEQIIPVALTIY